MQFGQLEQSWTDDLWSLWQSTSSPLLPEVNHLAKPLAQSEIAQSEIAQSEIDEFNPSTAVRTRTESWFKPSIWRSSVASSD
jgi:hypothetical protein